MLPKILSDWSLRRSLLGCMILCLLAMVSSVILPFGADNAVVLAQADIQLAEPRGIQQPLDSYDNLVPMPASSERYRQRGGRSLEGIQQIHKPDDADAVGVLFDQGHGNFYSINPNDDYKYEEFANLLIENGYALDASYSSQITYEDMKSYAVFVLTLPAFSPTAAEIVEIQKFVVEGGGLLLIADYDETYSRPSQELSRIFTVILNEDVVTDSEHDLSGIAHWVTYDSTNFSSHPIMQGVNTLQSYSSSSILHYDTDILIQSSSSADPANQAVAVADTYGLGRMVILGDSNYFDDIYGLGSSATDDNRQFAVNIMNWLIDNPENEAAQTAVSPATPSANTSTPSANTATPLPTATAVRNIPQATFTPTPTYTPSATYTPLPSLTPTGVPTATPFNQPTDLDGDGLLNDTEILGWTNGAGFFTTNPSNPDSDYDGLLDGEEKLFNTNPEDDTSPGIHIVYTNELRTRQYAGWTRFGNQYIARNTAVVRRGSDFIVGGPQGATVQVTKSTGSLSDLSYYVDPSVGRWYFGSDANGTVGTYTISLTRGNWSQSMTVHVVFELPTDMGQDHLNAYLYDDNPDTYKDETSVWFTTMEENYVTAENVPRHRAIGYGLSFQNDQYKEYVIELTMKTINGSSSRSEATRRLTDELDTLTRFDPTKYYYSMYEVLNAADARNQCSNIAAALTGLLRSAGIASRPVVVDWNGIFVGSGYFDTATEVWMGGRWQVTRAYNVIQGGEDSPSPIAGGIVQLLDTPTWGIYHYPIEFSDVIVTAGYNWEYEELNSINSKAYVWDDNSPYTIESKDWLWTKHQAYWGWSSEPTRVGDPAVLARSLSNERVNAHQPYMISQQTDAVFSGTYRDYKSTDETNEIAESLTIEAGVTVTKTGTYTYLLDANLYDNAGNQLRAVTQEALEGGSSYTMSVTFDGRDIYRHREDGPYHVELRLLEISNDTIQDKSIYTTEEYAYTDFQTPAIYFTDVYEDSLLDVDGDGAHDYLVLEAELKVSQPYSYTIMGTLADSRVAESNELSELEELTAKNGAIANTSVYTYLDEGTHTVKLLFDGTEIFANGNDGPFQIQEILVLDVQNPSPLDFAKRLIDGRSNPYSTTDYDHNDFDLPAAFFSNEYADNGVDLNDNGLYEHLVFDVGLGLEQTSVYTVVADLFDSTGQFMGTAIWSNAENVDGTADDATTMLTAQLKFDGLNIARKAADGGFSLDSLRILNAAGEVVEWIAKAFVTDEYTSSQFDGPSAQLSGIYDVTGKDVDDDGRYEYLVAQIEVDVAQEGEYRVEGWLADGENNLIVQGLSEMRTLEAGKRTLEIFFDGKAIHGNRVDGPFTLSGVNVVGSQPAGLAVIDSQTVAVVTEPFALTNLEYTPVSLRYADSGVDTTDDGLYEHLMIEVGMELDSSYAYTMTADLLDSDGALVESVSWSNVPDVEAETVVTAQLEFDGTKIVSQAVSGPFALANLQIVDGAGEIETIDDAFTTQSYETNEFVTTLQSFDEVDETTDQPTEDEVDETTDQPTDETVDQPADQPTEGAAAALTGNNEAIGEDSNDNGLFDFLVAGIEVEVSQPGQYQIEGGLFDSEGQLITRSSSDVQELTEGRQMMRIRFDGKAIGDHGVAGKYTLSELKLMGADATVIESLDDAFVTNEFELAVFEQTAVEVKKYSMYLPWISRGENGLQR